MDNKLEFLIDIVGNATEKLSQIQEQTKTTQGVMSKFGESMVKVNAIIGVAQTAYNAVSAGLSKIVSVGSATELQLQNLTTLYRGNADEAKAMYERLAEYGKMTVYDKAGLLDAQKTMMSFGFYAL